MVVLSSLLEGAQFETRLEGEVYLVRLVGVWEAATPSSHPPLLTHRRRVHVHSLSGSLPGQPRSRLSPCVMAIGAGSRARRRSGGHRVYPAHTRRPSRHPFHRVGSNLSSARMHGSGVRGPCGSRTTFEPVPRGRSMHVHLGGNLPLPTARSS